MKQIAPSVACLGRSNEDVFWTPTSMRYFHDRVELGFANTAVTIHTYRVPVPGGKCFAEIPPHPFALAAEVKGGGGLWNTARAYRLISYRVARYLDAVVPDKRLLREVEYLRMQARFLKLYPRPCNIVAGPDRTIFKPVTPAPADWNAALQEAVEWAAQAQIIAANSIGDDVFMTALTDAVKGAGTKLYAMVTPALAAPAVRRAIPACSAVFAASDEIPRIFGEEFAPTLEGAFRALAHVRALNPGATVFITLGKDGVLVGGPGAVPVLVRLRPGLVAEVQEHIRSNPGCNCGCGDAFFAGAVAWYADRESLAVGLAGGQESGVCASISGCAAAVRWTGFQTQLGRDDFQIAECSEADPLVWTAAA